MATILKKNVTIEASYYCSKERKMNALDELDALCSELLSLKNEFESIVSQTDFDLANVFDLNEQP